MSLAFAIGTIVTNLLLTALIAGRIFWLTKTTNGTSDHTTKKYPRLVAIFLESGLLYPLTVLIGICFLSVATPVELQPITAQTMASSRLLNPFHFRPLISSPLHLQGIAPTLMMVRVDLSASVEKAPEEFSTQHV
ncbi:hypothetical protein D9757_010553 [Collybiopsis confluens]|uniref:Uncharacterized protein n=1 Tax=Collybiopsis confluens TaxID=2823264 RepID=A0A8H5GYB9_9AGAR|nr:hypothetical protein D9757_010553 [Collybiopsis confluens]